MIENEGEEINLLSKSLRLSYIYYSAKTHRKVYAAHASKVFGDFVSAQVRSFQSTLSSSSRSISNSVWCLLCPALMNGLPVPYAASRLQTQEARSRSEERAYHFTPKSVEWTCRYHILSVRPFLVAFYL